MSDFVRVYNKETKAVHNWPAAASTEGLEVLKDAPTHDVYGEQLPPEYDVENKTAANKVAAKAEEAQK